MVAGSLHFYAWGLFAALACSALSYLAQALFTHMLNKRVTALQFGAIAAAIVSIALFIFGSERAIAGFRPAAAPTVPAASSSAPHVPVGV